MFAEKAAEGMINMKLTKKTAAIGVCILFAVLMLPIVVTCFYTYPVLDDYNFSVHSHWAVLDGESVLIAALENAHSFYMNWQGGYSANFWAGMQPFVFNVRLYCLSNLMVLALTIGTIAFFVSTVVGRLLRGSVWQWLLISAMLSLYFWEFIPSISEGLYWMDGSLNISFQCFFYIALSATIRAHLSHRNAFWGWSILACAIAVFLGGADYANVVCYLLTTVGAMLLPSVRNSRTKWLILAQNVLFAIGLLFNYFSPGTAVRADGMNGMPMLNALIMAVYNGFAFFGSQMNAALVGILLLSVAVIYPNLRKCRFAFPYPLTAAVLCFGFYCGGMSVVLLAKGELGALRQMNLYFLNFLMSMFALAVYLAGWLSKQLPKIPALEHDNISIPLLIAVCILAVCGCAAHGAHDLSTVDTAWGLYKGYTQQYAREMQARVDMLEDPDITDAVLKPQSLHPRYLISEPLSEDPDFWTNQSVAAYYRKNSVRLMQEDMQ